MSYQTGIRDNLLYNTLEIFFVDDQDPDATKITEANIASESMKLRQSICDAEALTFGGCIASQFDINLINTPERQFSADQLADKWISVKLTQTYVDDADLYPSDTLYPSNDLEPGNTTAGQPFWIFSGYIDTAVVDKTDKSVIKVTAYDVLAKLYEQDATNYLYNRYKYLHVNSVSTILGNVLNERENGVITIPTFGTNDILNEIYINQDETYAYVKDFGVGNSYWLGRKDRVSFGQLLKQICEILGVFGRIIPDDGKGKFTFKTLTGPTEIYGFYEKLESEDYQSTGYTGYQFSVSGDDRQGKSAINLAGEFPDAYDDATYKIYNFCNNILILQPYTKSGQGRTSTYFEYFIHRTSIGTRLAMNAGSSSHSGQCAFSAYQPLKATLDGRLWVNVGDPIQILVNETTVDGDYIYENGEIKKQTIQTYVLSRTLTGIQALTDNIEAKGVR